MEGYFCHSKSHLAGEDGGFADQLATVIGVCGMVQVMLEPLGVFPLQDKSKFDRFCNISSFLICYNIPTYIKYVSLDPGVKSPRLLSAP